MNVDVFFFVLVILFGSVFFLCFVFVLRFWRGF